MNHLERALDNQNQWWKYLVIFVGGFVASNIIGAIPLAIVLVVKMVRNGMTSFPANPLDFEAYGINPNVGLVLVIIPFIVALITVILLLKPLHRRNLKDVINGTSVIRWSHFVFAFIVWALLLAVVFVLEYTMDPTNFTMHFDMNRFLMLVLVALILMPFQTTYEEVLFRGYLAQGVYAWTRNRWLVILLPSLIFGFMHFFNPEVKEYGVWLTIPQYVLLGVLFGLTAVLDDGIETAMGAHAANNIFLSIFVTNKASVLQTPALLAQQRVDPLKDLFVVLVCSIIFIAILSFRYKWKFAVITQKVN
ncbi:MAG TPA: CPBP family intramembrane glutamic endopeptidase [Bacteroidales bacterium]|nr:CPBP family intramembrane glutamic endopeptidase [Bacteroidales bacterium]